MELLKLQQTIRVVVSLHGDLTGSIQETNVIPVVYALLPDMKLESFSGDFKVIKDKFLD